ncbi:hypothetical protein [Ruixingdingia sedimenti]|uniref:DUF669 domain-containing protein n=1 Tax=Ruixingdingia sedimenti TaxID=3073604 RepID=A0ABU1FCR5_9RHOB|nr:hypothetical protein [Xinfangfangia sp. LG-4]MDR5654373.1 hypothetical protein [Xinfangfangia sp. LG-4]
MSYDLNDAQPQMAPIGELIPDGTFAKVRLTVRPGGVDGATPMDAKLLKASQSSDAKMLDCEFTILEGPHARRKFWQSFTVAGGKVDEKGQSIGWKISKSTFRAMVDSALGLDPRDESPDAKAKRVLPGLKHLDGIVFAARIMVEPASNPQYRDQNRIANVVLPDEPQHGPIMRGQAVPPEPVNAPPRKAASAPTPGWQAPTPAWGAQPQAPAAAPAWGAPAPAPQQPPQQPPAQQPPASPPNAPGGAPATGMPAWLNG